MRFESPRDVDGGTAPAKGETVDQWSDRLIRIGKKLGIFRQCSLGWHDECSDPDGDGCRCTCHPSESTFTQSEARMIHITAEP